MADDIVQIIENARVDATSLSEFIYYPANVMVQRRLAPSIHTLNYYLDYLHGLELVYKQPTGTVVVNGEEVKTVRQAIKDAIDEAVLGNYQAELELKISNEVDRATVRENSIEDALEEEVTRATNTESNLTQSLSELDIKVTSQKLDSGITTWSSRTQESKNRDAFHSKDFGLVPNSSDDQFLKMKSFLETQGNLTLESGTYYMGETPTDIQMLSNTTLSSYGAVLDYRSSTNTSNGRIRAYGSTVEATYNLTSNSLKDTNTLVLDSVVGIKLGTVLYVKSESAWSTDCKSAEIVRVIGILNNTVYLSTTFSTNYNTSNTVVERYNVRHNTNILGLELWGSGKNSLVGGKVDRAIHFNQVANCLIKDVVVSNFDRMGIMVGNCYNTYVDNCDVGMTPIDSDKNYIQYAISVFDAVTGGAVMNCTVSRGRHGIAYTTYSGYGYSKGHRLLNNNISKTTSSGIATHQTNADLYTQANTMTDCWGGLDIRVKNATSVNDKVIRPTYGYVLRADISNLKIVNGSVEDCFNAVYGATELTGSITTLDIFNLGIKNATNDGIKLTLPTGVSVGDLRLRHVCTDGVAGEGISLSGAFTGGYVKDMQTVNQPSSRYGVRLAGTTSISVTGGHFGGRPVRSESYNGVACTGTRVIGNQYTGDYIASSIAIGNQVGAFSQGNIRSDVSPSKSVTAEAITVSEGLGYVAVFVSITATLSTFSGSVGVGEELLLTKAGAGALTITSSGNITLKSGNIVLTSNTQVVRFVFNGAVWLEV